MSEAARITGRTSPGLHPKPRIRRASDGDAMVVLAACMPYAVPIDQPVPVRADDPLPFGMFKHVSPGEVRAARRAIRERRNA